MENSTCHKCKKNKGVNTLSRVKYKNKIYLYKICHECSKEVYLKYKDRVVKWHKDNIEKVRFYKRKYSKTKRKLVSKKQDKVREMVKLAIKKGLLIRGCCNICGKNKAQAHHENYNKPFEIMWLCSKHHREHEETTGLRKKKYQKNIKQ